MISFNVFYELGENTVISIENDRLIFELRAMISSTLDYEYNDIRLFLIKYGPIDDEDLVSLPLSILSLDENTTYTLIVLKRDKYGIESLFCTGKIIEDSQITQPGFLVKSKGNIPVCEACKAICHSNENSDHIEVILEKEFSCLCKLSGECLFESSKFNLSDLATRKDDIKMIKLKCIEQLNKKHERLVALRENDKTMCENKKILLRNFDFESSMRFGLVRVFMYESGSVTKSVLDVIPFEEINKEALENSKNSSLSMADEKVKSLLFWFKKSFFTWCDKPICENCNKKAENYIQSRAPNEEEKIWSASRTEVYQCMDCNKHSVFPRYNSPEKLCITRTGRCGEWANLFGCILRVCGYKVRFIDNFEDHVWNEYWSSALKRWVHVDSCENAWDTPLLYEQGWGRKMTFILAHSTSGIYDVTRRYVKDWQVVKARRSHGEEAKLQTLLISQNNKLREDLPPECIEELYHIDLSEREELLKDRPLSQAEMLQRESGSEDWKRSRKEFK